MLFKGLSLAVEAVAIFIFTSNKRYGYRYSFFLCALYMRNSIWCNWHTLRCSFKVVMELFWVLDCRDTNLFEEGNVSLKGGAEMKKKFAWKSFAWKIYLRKRELASSKRILDVHFGGDPSREWVLSSLWSNSWDYRKQVVKIFDEIIIII